MRETISDLSNSIFGGMFRFVPILANLSTCSFPLICACPSIQARAMDIPLVSAISISLLVLIESWSLLEFRSVLLIFAIAPCESESMMAFLMFF